MDFEEEQAVERDESAPSVEEEELLEEEQGELSQEDDSDFVETDNPNVKKRIDRLTAEKYEARRQQEEAERLAEERERENEELRRQLAQRSQKTDEEILNAPEPVEDDFDTIAEYQEAARSHWQKVGEARGRISAREEREQQQAQQAWESAHNAYIQGAEKARSDHEDFDQTVGAIRLTEEAQVQLIRDSNPETVYQIAKNHPDLLSQLQSARTKEQRTAVLARADERLKNPPKPKKVTEAGAPVTTATTGGGTKPSRDSFEEKYPTAVIK